VKLVLNVGVIYMEQPTNVVMERIAVKKDQHM